MAARDLPENREWTRRDEINDRGVTEGPVSAEHHSRNGHRTVDAIPGLYWRPGSRS